jgi:hypothetical protein
VLPTKEREAKKLLLKVEPKAGATWLFSVSGTNHFTESFGDMSVLEAGESQDLSCVLAFSFQRFFF